MNPSRHTEASPKRAADKSTAWRTVEKFVDEKSFVNMGFHYIEVYDKLIICKYHIIATYYVKFLLRLNITFPSFRCINLTFECFFPELRRSKKIISQPEVVKFFFRWSFFLQLMSSSYGSDAFLRSV